MDLDKAQEWAGKGIRGIGKIRKGTQKETRVWKGMGKGMVMDFVVLLK